MEPFLTIWSLGGISVCIFVMRSFLREYHAKGVKFSSRRFIVLSHAYATVVMAPAVAILVFLCRHYEFDYSPRPDVGVGDLGSIILVMWLACALCFLCLLLSRAGRP